MLGFARIADIAIGSDGKSKFTVYNVHMNDVFHCSLRYSQLLEFQNELKVNFDTSMLEEFPPKHLFSLSEYQHVQRRVMLERFIQSVCQNRVIGPSDLVKEYWIGAQRASSDLTTPTGEVDVYLVNGKKVTLSVGLSDRADQVLEQVGGEIDLNPDLTYYFGLFLERESDNALIAPVTEYQSPLITLHTINKGGTSHRLTLRQHFWDPVLAPPLLEDKVAKNMLYIEALASVTRGQLDLSAETKEKLAAMKSKGLKKEYLECMFEQPQFGYRQIEGFTFDHPVEGMEGCVRVGKNEVITYTNHGVGRWAQCQRYPITRIRSWKVGYDSKVKQPWVHLNFQLSREEFVWVQLSGEHSVFLNLCLHSAVTELLRLRTKTPIHTPSSQPIQRTLREFPRFTVTQAPPSSLESSGSEDQRSTDDSATTSEATDGPTPSPGTHPHNHTPSPGASVSTHTSTKPGAPSRKLSSESDNRPNKKPAGKRESKSKKVKSPSEVENVTFNFGTDDDL